VVDGFPPTGGWSECLYVLLETHIFMILKKPSTFGIPNSVFQDAGTESLKHIKPAHIGSLRKAVLE